MQRIIKIFSLLFVGLLFYSQNFCQDSTALGSSVTLKQAVDIAIKNNLVVQQTDITMQNNAVYRNQSLSNLLPQINGSANQGIYFGKSINQTTYQYVNQQQSSGTYSL